jgi:hypothetical protein
MDKNYCSISKKLLFSPNFNRKSNFIIPDDIKVLDISSCSYNMKIYILENIPKSCVLEKLIYGIYRKKLDCLPNAKSIIFEAVTTNINNLPYMLEEIIINHKYRGNTGLEYFEKLPYGCVITFNKIKL